MEQQNPQPETDYDARVELIGAARTDAWNRVGALDPYVMAHAINPGFMGGPVWPAFRQAFVKVVLPGGAALVASDGLSDPFEHEPSGIGLGLELYMVGDFAATLVENLKERAEFGLVYEMAQNIANNGPGVVEALDQYGALSMEFEEAPEAFQREDGPFGVLIGINHPEVPTKIELPSGTVRLVGLTALHPDELAAIVEHGVEMRKQIAARLTELDPKVLASIGRPSVVRE